MGNPSAKPEFPPLLLPGLHPSTFDELHRLCVTPFPGSQRRPVIYGKLKEIAGVLDATDTNGDLWVDGSFLTCKEEPNDADICLRVLGDFYDSANPNQRAAIDWVGSNLQSTHHCDSYIFMRWREGHKNYWAGEIAYAYWLRQFSLSRGNEMKGIALLKLGRGAA